MISSASWWIWHARDVRSERGDVPARSWPENRKGVPAVITESTPCFVSGREGLAGELAELGPVGLFGFLSEALSAIGFVFAVVARDKVHLTVSLASQNRRR